MKTWRTLLQNAICELAESLIGIIAMYVWNNKAFFSNFKALFKALFKPQYVATFFFREAPISSSEFKKSVNKIFFQKPLY